MIKHITPCVLCPQNVYNPVPKVPFLLSYYPVAFCQEANSLGLHFSQGIDAPYWHLLHPLQCQSLQSLHSLHIRQCQVHIVCSTSCFITHHVHQFHQLIKLAAWHQICIIHTLNPCSLWTVEVVIHLMRRSNSIGQVSNFISCYFSAIQNIIRIFDLLSNKVLKAPHLELLHPQTCYLRYVEIHMH